eukprot:455596-Pelagomonas_calceolata.AAC.1
MVTMGCKQNSRREKQAKKHVNSSYSHGYPVQWHKCMPVSFMFATKQQATQGCLPACFCLNACFALY